MRLPAAIVCSNDKENPVKNKLSTILPVLTFIIGLSLLLYPTVSGYWNSFLQTRAIARYTEQVANLDHGQYEKIWAAAQKYNQTLTQRDFRVPLSEEELAEYEQVLDVTGTGAMGYIEIPAISVNLPIYHSVSESVLQVAVGHVPGSSLPVGGESTHCVLSGHRGLPSAKLFTDLDRLALGDVFLLHVLDEVLTYRVDQILIVEPYDIDALEIIPGEDLCTLMTCTPYGINTHRMLIRGHRVES